MSVESLFGSNPEPDGVIPEGGSHGFLQTLLNMSNDNLDFSETAATSVHPAFIRETQDRKDQREFTSSLIHGLAKYKERYEDSITIVLEVRPESNPKKPLSSVRVLDTNMIWNVPRSFHALPEVALLMENTRHELAKLLLRYQQNFPRRASFSTFTLIPIVTEEATGEAAMASQNTEVPTTPQRTTIIPEGHNMTPPNTHHHMPSNDNRCPPFHSFQSTTWPRSPTRTPRVQAPASLAQSLRSLTLDQVSSSPSPSPPSTPASKLDRRTKTSNSVPTSPEPHRHRHPHKHTLFTTKSITISSTQQHRDLTGNEINEMLQDMNTNPENYDWVNDPVVLSSDEGK